MGQSRILHYARKNILAGVFDNLTMSQAETLEILADVDQMTNMMSSLLDARCGQIVKFEDAFADI